MRIMLIAWLTIVLAGCGSTGERPQSLHSTFESYRAAIASGNLVARRAEFFTSVALNEIDINSKSDVMELSIGSYLVKEHSHHENIHPDRGCLTINGYLKNGDPVSMFIEYKPQNGRWLMNHTNVRLPSENGINRFPEKALCPKEALEEFEQGK